MTEDTEERSTPIAANQQDLERLNALVQRMIELLEEKGILTAEEVAEAARTLETEASEPAAPE